LLYLRAGHWYTVLPGRGLHIATISWSSKNTVTFSDAMTAIRRWIWLNWVFEKHHEAQVLRNLPRHLTNTILYAMTQAT
jgi:hypothetical protein